MEMLRGIIDVCVSSAFFILFGFLLIICWIGLGHWVVNTLLTVWRSGKSVGKLAFFSALAIATLHAQKSGTNGQQRVQRHAPISQSALSDAELAAGFAITRIGTNEVWDFSPSENAVFATNWLKRGAAEDCFAIMPEVNDYTIGTAKVSRLFMSSTGIAAANTPRSNPAVRPIPDESGAVFLAPFRTRLGIVPAFNWPLLNGRESRFWHDVTETDVLRLTWENALYARETDFPVSVRAELHPNGDFVFRYTVLGLGIEHAEYDLSTMNRLAPTFGIPFTVSTNVNTALELDLRTDVLLTNGFVRLEIENASTRFKVYCLDRHSWVWRELIDSESNSAYETGIDRWRKVFTARNNRRATIRVTAAEPGHCNLVFAFAVRNDAVSAHDRIVQRLTSVAPPLLPDYNRDGVIGETDISFYLAGRLAYFWRNDDTYKGDNAFETSIINHVNSANNIIDGHNDLINFLPIAVDVRQFLTHWDMNRVRYCLEAYSDAMQSAKMTFAVVPWENAGGIPCDAGTNLANEPLRDSAVFPIGMSTHLPPDFAAKSSENASTILMEFPVISRGDTLSLRVYDIATDRLLFTAPLNLYIGDVEQMIGWTNIRSAAGGSGGIATRFATQDWPASEHEEGSVVFVHGYNMEEEDEAPQWAKNVFKKLWWSGLNRGFVAVQWRGNEGQVFETVTPNYYGNVQNAFQTAAALSNAMESVRGPKWFLAHSLGNMLVSAAIQDYGMTHEKYFMLNAAVAMEAFDPADGISTESHDNMTPVTWTNYTDRVRATHWFERFPEDDGRRLLTWKGRFSNVTNIVNFYSTEEEVVNNGDGVARPLHKRNYVWYNQETRKGL